MYFQISYAIIDENYKQLIFIKVINFFQIIELIRQLIQVTTN